VKLEENPLARSIKKTTLGKKKTTKKEEEFSRWKSEEYHHKKTEFQTAAFPPLSFRP
jgi:hypothetical protein